VADNHEPLVCTAWCCHAHTFNEHGALLIPSTGSYLAVCSIRAFLLGEVMSAAGHQSSNGELMQRFEAMEAAMMEAKWLSPDPFLKKSRRKLTDVYELCEVIGEGADGEVFQAIHRGGQGRYAVKIHEQGRRGWDHDGRLAPIYRNWWRIAHPHILAGVDVCEHEGRTCWVTEFAPYGDLFDYIRLRGSMSALDALHVMVQLVDAVRYMHEKMRITHGDIKLENIFIRSLKPMQVILGDLDGASGEGCANQVHPEVSMDSACAHACMVHDVCAYV
jgi:hypothetical protein